MTHPTSTGGTARILAIDAGGTMTDSFFIDERGEFVVGKAQTTPEDESVGFMRSAEDALRYWDQTVVDAFPRLRSGIYSGTAMLNRVLERKGRKVGIIVSAGMEDYLRLERAVQTYLGYSYSDRLHIVTHRHNEPLVPRKRVFGVRGRVDVFGKEAIPLYEDEARAAVAALLEMGVDSIVVNLLYSFKHPAHEQRVRAIAEEVIAATGARATPVYLSSELYPLRADFPRLNATLLEAYAAEPSREQLQKLRVRTREAGASFDLRIMASHGGTISIDARELGRTLVSGPIGGVIGAKYLAERLGTPNVACTDIGGTSFDIALITDGEFQIRNVPDVARLLLNIPLVQIDSVGAGTGSFVRVNPSTHRIEVGPDSAGARIGVSWPEGGLDTVSITDCNVVLGTLNPDYFLGGDLTLDRERAVAAVRTQVAEPLGLSVEDAAAGVVELFEDQLRNALLGQIVGKGYGPENYTLLSYGGGGPLHVGGYSQGLAFGDVLVPAWAAGFSAFGCACGDFEYRADRSVDLPLLPTYDDATRVAMGGLITAAWDQLCDQVAAEFAKSGVDRDAVEFRPALRVQYYGQLNDLEYPSPVARIETPQDVDAVLAAFEALYATIYRSAARTPEFGHLVTRAIVTGRVDVEKPALPAEPIGPEAVDEAARKPGRPVYWHGAWQDAEVLQLEALHAGVVIRGLAIVESPASTFVVPPGRVARLDQHRIFHLS